MTAAASAAIVVTALSDRPGLLGGVAVALGLVVAGGLVEGLALGTAQATVLARRWPLLGRRRFVVLTTVVAGLGWAAGSAPGVLASADTGPEPALVLLVAGAAGIGLLMGPVLGGAQAWALRGVVGHPWRWVVANTVAWPPAMVVIFLGATRPETDWSPVAVIAIGAVTGLVAGTTLGLLTGLWLRSLDGQPVHNRIVLSVLEAERMGMQRKLVGLAVRGRRSGIVRRFPTQYAEDDAGLVVVPGGADHKTWWRNLDERGTPIEVLAGGGWRPAVATLLRPDDPGYEDARSTYRRRWARVSLPETQPVVRIVDVMPGEAAPGATRDRREGFLTG